MRVYLRGVSTSISQQDLKALVLVLCVVCALVTLWYFTEADWGHSTVPPATSGAWAAPTDTNDPSLTYGAVLDCGSSGTRAYVYYWLPHSGKPGQLLNIKQMRDSRSQLVVKKIEPGLSSLAEEPWRAIEYISPLLDFVAEHIPADKHMESPLYIMATAGLRLLPQSQQTALLENLREEIPLRYKFQFSSTQAEVISGRQEGIYAWIGLNYVLQRFVEQDEGPRPRTAGILDMGGGSVQIAYEVTDNNHVSSSLTELSLGCQEHDQQHTYQLYVATFLGYGGNSARDRYVQMLVDKNNGTTKLIDPCLPKGCSDRVFIQDTSILLQGSGEFTECVQTVLPLLNRTCSTCPINSIHLPPIDYINSEFFGFSEFYYTMEDVYRMAGLYQKDTFLQASQEFCGTPWDTLQERYEKNLYPKADERRFKMQCFKAAWMSAVFHQGFLFPDSYSHLTSTQLIAGVEVQWTLGALVYKTRYFPLRTLHSSSGYKSYVYAISLPMSLSVLTLVLVLCYIVSRRKQVMARVPTLALLMMEPGQEEKTYQRYIP